MFNNYTIQQNVMDQKAKLATKVIGGLTAPIQTDLEMLDICTLAYACQKARLAEATNNWRKINNVVATNSN